MGRIITVSSGKGGVGKTTFAVNFALTLSRVAPTVLIDLDSGTLPVRYNFAYIAHRALHVIRNPPSDNFGQARLFTPPEIFHQMFPHRGR